MDIESKISHLEKQISRLQYLVMFLTVVIVLIVIVSISQAFSYNPIYRIDIIALGVVIAILVVACLLYPSQDVKQGAQPESTL